MPHQRVAIVGAGLAGMTLGCCLKARGIPSIVYEKSSTAHRYGYSIVLAQYQPLLHALGIPFQTFHSRTAVRPELPPTAGGPFRVRRAALEDLLRERCDIRYGCELERFSISPSSPGGELRFSNGETLSASIVVAADGIHSSLRSIVFPEFQLSVLPYVAFNGKRNLSPSAFAGLKQHFSGHSTLSCHIDDVLLQAYVNECTEEGGASISYTYSRPPRSQNDACYKPNRSKASARDIPAEFFAEIENLQLRPLEEPWKSILDVSQMKKGDRLLHWLMRSGLPPRIEIEARANDGCVLIGDALLTSPIIGSEGADKAITQASDLSRAIEEDRVPDWFSSNFGGFVQVEKQGRQRLCELHSSSVKAAVL